jgi:hypothetical protein
MKKTLLAVAVGVVVLGAAAFGIASATTNKPTYFVDGAVATGGGAQSDTDHSGCVPYSSDRPDVFVCDPNAPSDFVPTPKPYYDENICGAAMQWLTTRGHDSEVDPSTCLVQESQNGGNWMILFKGKDGGISEVVPYDPTGQDTGAAHQ